MKNISLSIAFVLLLSTALPAMGESFKPEVDPWIWKQPSAAELTFEPFHQTSRRASGDNPEFEDETRSVGQFIADMSEYMPNICVTATPMKYEGTHINNMRLDFGGESIKENDAVDSNASLNDLFVALYYGLPFVKTASRDRLNIDLGINVRTIDLEKDIQNEPIGQPSESNSLPIPMVFAAVQFHPVDVLAIEAEGRGISIDGKKSYGLIGRLRWNTYGPIYAAGGYRYSKYEIQHDGTVVDAAINGPFIEACLSF